jgi:predicted RNase H-like nuclease (RuvC/YqgF family)
MTRGGKALSVMLVVLLGLWGCARGPVGHSAQAERIRSLETKCAKLEDDYRSVAAARDQARKQIAALEAERAQLKQDLADKQAIVKERDALRQQIATRTNERDNLKLRCDRLKKGLQELLGQDDAMLPAAPAPTAASNDAPRTAPTQS